jgi:hypothetical protein
MMTGCQGIAQLVDNGCTPVTPQMHDIEGTTIRILLLCIYFRYGWLGGLGIIA